MAVSMDALLKIKAAVSGTDEINGLSKAIDGVGKTAAGVSGGLKGLLSSVGGLSGALGALTPLLSGAGLLAMAKGALDAGNQMYLMSQKTGVSVEMLSRFKSVAARSGTDLDTVGASLMRLSKTMTASLENSVNSATNITGAARKGWAAQVQAAEQHQQEMVRAVQAGADQQVRAVQDTEKRQLAAIQDGEDQSLQRVQDGEQRQVDEIERAKDERIAVLERETDQRLKEINRRYRQEEKLLNDNYDDRRDADRQQLQDQQTEQERQVERRYETRRKAIEQDKNLSQDARDQAIQDLRDQQDAEMRQIRDGFEQRQKQQDRYYRDQREAAQQAIDDRKQAEEDGVRQGTAAQKKALEDRAKMEEAQAKKAATAQEKLIKANAEAQKQAAKAAAQESIKAIQTAAKDKIKALTDEQKMAVDAFKSLGIKLRDAMGNVRNPADVMKDVAHALMGIKDPAERAGLAFKLLGKSGANSLPFLAELDKSLDKTKAGMSTAFAEKAHESEVNLTRLGGKVRKLGLDLAEGLLPFMETTTELVTTLVDAFNGLPGPLRGIVVAGAALAVTWGPLTGIIGGLIKVFVSFPAIVEEGFWVVLEVLGGVATAFQAIGPILSGMAGFAVSAVSAILGAFVSLVTWLFTVFLPTVIEIFSGPIGWTVLAIAAVVGMCIAFREPIMQFLQWLPGALLDGLKGLGGWLASVWAGFTSAFQKYVTVPISNAWNAMIQALPNAMKSAGNFMMSMWVGIVNNVKGMVRGMLIFIANCVNPIGDMINNLIRGFNNLSAKVHGPILPFVPTYSVPVFATGGVVNGPTLAMVGDGGEREYILGESKMAEASRRFLAGARGSAVIPSNSSGGPAAAGSPAINITTGPVLEFDGQRYVTMADFERGMRITAEGVIGRLRTPAARIALGMA